jgi:hypothetical protein
MRRSKYLPHMHCSARRFSQISIDNQRLDELLGPIMGHQFNISRQQMKRGLVYKGAGYRCAAH